MNSLPTFIRSLRDKCTRAPHYIFDSTSIAGFEDNDEDENEALHPAKGQMHEDENEEIKAPTESASQARQRSTGYDRGSCRTARISETIR
jgi:hypothetical protein